MLRIRYVGILCDVQKLAIVAVNGVYFVCLVICCKLHKLYGGTY